MALVSWIGRRVAGIARRSGVPLYATIRGPGPVGGLRMELEGAKLRQLAGRHEPVVQDCIAERLRPGGCFIDVGADVGFFSLLAARLAGPGGRVIAIEPVPAHADLIKANATLNRFDNVTIVTAAAGAVNRTGAMITAHPPVPMLTLDGLVSHLGLPPPSMIRIDVEGAEIEVLAGMSDTLWRHHPDILFEIDARSADEAASRYAKMSEALTHYGYEVRRLEDDHPGEGGPVVHGIGVFE
jgi:FkbM family methyltransferase